MRIKDIIKQDRRDFEAIFFCEHCGEEEIRIGYDDEHFHRDVIPLMKCPKCNKVASSTYRPLTTKYPDGFHI